MGCEGGKCYRIESSDPDVLRKCNVVVTEVFPCVFSTHVECKIIDVLAQALSNTEGYMYEYQICLEQRHINLQRFLSVTPVIGCQLLFAIFASLLCLRGLRFCYITLSTSVSISFDLFFVFLVATKYVFAYAICYLPCVIHACTILTCFPFFSELRSIFS